MRIVGCANHKRSVSVNFSSHYQLTNRTVLITGAGGGLGLAIAQAFAAQGCVTIMVDRNAAALYAARQTIAYAQADTIVCDLDSDASVQALVSRVGRVDILVNNAGTEYPTPLTGNADMAAPFASLLDNNVTSMARLTNALLQAIPDGGCIINQASTWALMGVPGFSAYVASKHAVIGLTRSMAWELGPRGIRVNAVCPGWVFTDAASRSLRTMAISEGIDPELKRRAIIERQAIHREVTPADVARMFLFLASDDAAAITGQSLAVNYGEVMA